MGLPVPDPVGSPDCLEMVPVKKLLPGPVISCFATRSGTAHVHVSFLLSSTSDLDLYTALPGS